MITFTCSDGEVKVAKTAEDLKRLSASKLIAMMLEGEDDDNIDIPLPDIKCSTFSKIVFFMHKNMADPMPEIQKPLKSAVMRDNTVQWAADFATALTHDELFDVVLGANYLEYETCLDLGCAAIAALLKSRTPKEIRELFGIQEPMPEEEQKVREDNAWIFEVRPVTP